MVKILKDYIFCKNQETFSCCNQPVLTLCSILSKQKKAKVVCGIEFEDISFDQLATSIIKISSDKCQGLIPTNDICDYTTNKSFKFYTGEYKIINLDNNYYAILIPSKQK